MYKSLVLLLLLTVATTMAPADAVAGPGSGWSEIIGANPAYHETVPVNTTNKWSIKLTATEQFSNGVVHFEIPDGWTPPQNTAPNSPGYVSIGVTVIDTMDAWITNINGRTVEVRVNRIDLDEGILLIYGDDGGIARPGARVTSPSTPQVSYFRILTHPTDSLGTPEYIADPDSIVVTPDVPVNLAITPGNDTEVDAGVAVTYTVVMKDAYGNRTWSDTPTSFDLHASEGTFYDSYPVPGTEITNVLVPAFVDSFTFDYRSVVASTGEPYTITVSNAALFLSEATTIIINPLPDIKKIGFTSGPYAFTTVSEGGPYAIETQDSLGNPHPVDANQQIDLNSTSGGGSFSTQGGANFTPVTSVTIPNGQSTVSFYYRDTNKGTPTISATAFGQPAWLDTMQTQTVNPGPPARFDITPAGATLAAGAVTLYTATVVDEHGNTTPLTEAKTVLLQPPVGDFYDPGVITQKAMASGDTSFTVDFRSNTAGDGLIVMLTDDFRLFGATPVTVDAGLPNAGASTVEATTNITASGTDSSYVTVTVRDQYGNSIPDEAVTIVATGDATAISPVAVTDINGEWTGYVTNTTAELVTVTAQAGALSITDDAQVLFVHGGVYPDSSMIAADSPVAADGAATSTIIVAARDAQNNPIPNATVTLFVEPQEGAILTQPSALTDALGRASGTLKSTAAGDRVVKAVINGTGVTDSVTVTFEAGPISTTVSSVEATSPVVANGILSSAVTVTVTDAQGNPISGKTVEIAASDGANAVSPLVPTDINGEWTGYVTHTVAGPVTVTATAGGFALTDNAIISFIAGVVDGAQSTIAAAPGTVFANGTTASTITVTARDANDNPVAGQSVTLSVNPGGANVVLNQPGGLTDGAGQVTSTILSTDTGIQTINANIGGVPVTSPAAVVSFVAGPVDYFVWTVPGTGTAGGATAVTLTAYDAQDNVKTDYQGIVTLTTNGSGTITWGPGSGDGFMIGNQYTFVLTDNGSATIAVTNTRMETFRLTAADGGANGTSTDIVIDHAAAASIQVVDGAGQTATVYNDVGTSPRIRVSDTYGNLVDAEPVTFRLINPGNGAEIDVDAGGGGANDSTGTTDASGELACDRWRLAQGAGPNRLMADLIGVGFVYFNALGTPDEGDEIVITPFSQNVTFGTLYNLTATLEDQWNNRVPGERVDIFIKPTADGTLSNDPAAPTSFTSPTSRFGTTDANGQIKVRYDAPATAGLTDNVDASSLPSVTEGDVLDAVYTTVASGATNLRTTFVTADSARAGESFELLVEAVDGNGNVDAVRTDTVDITPEALSGLEFSLDAGFASTITQFDLASGAQTVYGRGGPVGDWDITMATGGLGDATDPVRIIDSGVIDHYFVSTVANVTAGTNFDVTVEAQDLFDNRVMSAGNTVDLVAVDAASPTTVLPDGMLVPQITLINGRFTVTQQYPTSVNMLVRARDGSSNEGFSAPVSVTTSAAYQIVYVAGDTTNVVAGTSRELIAEVRDQFDNPVAGANVTYVSTSGGGILPAQPVTTGPAGRVAVTFITGPVVGDNGVKATILDGSPESRERINFLVSTIAGPIDTLVVTADRTAIKAGELVTLDVSALDANDNLVELDNTTLVDFTAPGSPAVVADPTGQLAGGTFTTTVVDTKVESFTVVVQVQGSGPIGFSPLISVSNAAADSVIQVTLDETGITVGDTRVLAVDVRDRYGNAVPNEFVRYSLLPAGGPDGTARLSNNGIAQTNASGRATDSLYTAVTAGENVVDATIGAGPPPPELGVTFNMTTVADAIDYYTVDLNASQQTAGAATLVTVRAYDSSDNLVVGDSTTPVRLLLDPGTGPLFGDIPPITLAAGTLQTTLTVTEVQTVNVRAQTDGDPSTTGLSGPLTIVPDVPAGIVTLTPTKATITANGISTTTITSDIITDQFGNQIPQGALIDVATSDSESEILPDTLLSLRADGTVRFVLRSSTTPGTANVTLNSVAGSANGALNIVFAPKPFIVTALDPIPNSVIVGLDQQFLVPVANTSTTTVTFNTATRFEFTDGTETFSAALADLDTVFGSSVDTLVFALTTVPANITPARYQPIVQLEGADEFGSSYSMTDLLPVQSLLVSSIEIIAITADRIGTTISKGAVDTLHVRVFNPTPDSVTVVTAVPEFKLLGPAAYIQEAPVNLPLPIPGGEWREVLIPLKVADGAPTGDDIIDAQVTALVGGNTASDNSLDPYTLPGWRVVSARDIRYAAGSLAPATVSIGRTYAMSVRLRNDGAATVSIDTAGTSISFTDGTETYTANLASAVAIPGGGSQLLQFKPRAVPVGMAPGVDRNVTVTVSGIENGLSFVDVRQTSSEGDGVNVVLGAIVTVENGTLNPVTVSRGTEQQFSVDVRNTGGATVELIPDNTRFFFAGVAYEAYLDDNFTTTLTPGFHTLTFLSETVVGTLTPNTYTPTVELSGTENGLPFSQTIGFDLTNQVTVQAAPDIAITSIRSSRSKFTADQARPVDVWMTVVNSGGSTVRFDDARLRFILGANDRTSQFAITNPTQFATGGANLAGGGSIDSLRFEVTDEVANAMSSGVMTIEGQLWVTDENPPVTQIFTNTDLGGKGSLLVQTPALLVIESITPTQDPVTVSQATPAFEAEMVIRNDGESDVRVKLTNDSTDVTFSPAGGWLADPPVFAGGGDLVAGGQTRTVVVNVTRAGNTAGTIQLGGDVEAEELNSGDAVSVTGSGVGTIEVENAAVLTVSNVRVTRPTVTSGSGVPWEIRADVQNTGQATMNLDLPNSITVSIPDQTGTVVDKPATLVGGGTTLDSGQGGEMRILVTQTGSFFSFGAKPVTVGLGGVEVNTGVTKSGSSIGSVTVQEPADPQYLAFTIDPPVVSKGSEESFVLSIRNPLASSATMRINRGQTRLRFGEGLFDAGLDVTSPDSIPGNQTRQLRFEATEVSALMDGAGVVTVELHWEENGADSARTLTLGAVDLDVQDAGQLQIVSITPTPRATVTRGQAQDFFINMVVRNNGQADVRMSFHPDSTAFQFEPLSGLPVTGEYGAITFESGNPLIPGGGGQQNYTYRVSQGGATTGPVKVAAVVAGYDQTSGLPVFDNTIDGGSGGFTLQTPADLDILSIVPSQSTATAGQGRNYYIDVAVRNNGESMLDLTPIASRASLTFSFSGGWVWNAPVALVGGGTTLGDNETDTLKFVVDVTGSTAQPTIIGATVSGTEINSDDTRSATVNPGAPLSGVIDVQNPGIVTVSNVRVSQPSVTRNSIKDWVIWAAVQNTGEADLRLVPDSLDVTFEDETGAPNILYPTGLVSGGWDLPGNMVTTDTLRFRVRDTGNFDSLGDKNITVRAAAIELNSGLDRANQNGATQVAVQDPPDLQYLAGFSPQFVSQGATVRFQLTLRNQGANLATARIEPATSFTIADQPYTTTLTAADSIPADGEKTLTFNAAPVNVPNNTYTVGVNAKYSHNGNSPPSAPVAVSDQLTVQQAPSLSIVSVTPSQSNVTEVQSRRWFVDVAVENNGDAPVRIDFDPAATQLIFDHVELGARTFEYSPMGRPTAFQISGTDEIPAGSTDTLRYTITTTGATPGSVNIEATVEGNDVNTSDLLDDDTRVSGGGGFVNVQTAAIFVVSRVSTSRATVTEGQGTDWRVWAVVENRGGSSVTLDVAGASLSFDEGLWTWNTATGNTALGPGAVDSLVFVVDQTTETEGDRLITADVVATEDNSGTSVPESNTGSILVQTRPNVRFVTTGTELITPNAVQARVNIDQFYRVAVEVTNDGEAEANQVTYRAEATQGAAVPPTRVNIPSLSLGETVADTFQVRAASAADAGSAFATIFDVVDANGLERRTPVHPDSVVTVPVTVDVPAGLVVDSVTANVTNVTQKQSVPWYVDVTVRNTGDADLRIDDPAGADISFARTLVPQNDYVVLPPDSFLTADTDWVLAGRSTETLRYYVTVTGNGLGAIDVSADIVSTDINDPTSKPTYFKQTSVVVEEPSGVFIEKTDVSGLHKRVDNIWYVNTGISFGVSITVNNTGEALDDVVVALASNAGISTVPVGPDTKDIEADSMATFDFLVTAQSNPVSFQTLTATITSAISRNTQQPVVPGSSQDNTKLLIVQSKAELSIESLAVTWPQNATDGTLSTGQLFDVTTRVTNLGQASVAGADTVALRPPAGFAFNAGPADSLRALVLDSDITWRLVASTQPGDFDLESALTVAPKDVNINSRAALADSVLSLTVTVETAGAFTFGNIAIVAPVGATDDTVSAGQTFDVDAPVTVTSTVENIQAEILPVGGLQAIGSATVDLGNGDGGEKTASFTLQVPADSTSFASYRIAVSGTDINTSETVTDTSIVRPVVVVLKTSLSLAAEINRPREAQNDSTVTIGSTFTLGAVVSNAMAAAGIDPAINPAQVGLVTPLPGGYTLVRNLANQDFVPGDSVVWDIRAPSVPSGPDVFRIRIVSIPDDENTNAPAEVVVIQQSIPIVTEGAGVTMADVTEDLGIDNKVVPGSAVGVDKMAFELMYEVTDPSVNDALVDTVYVTILDKNRQPLSPQGVGGTLAALYIDVGSEQVRVANPQANPVAVPVTSAPNNAAIIAPDGSVTLVAGMDLKGNPSAGEISLSIARSRDVVIRDIVSRTRLGVTDAATGQPIDGKFVSAPLVIMSNDFAEYVHNYPNPFQAGSQSTSITYFLTGDGAVSIRIFDLLGNLVYELEIAAGQEGATDGPQEVEWDGRNMKGEVVRNGVYVCVLSAGSNSAKFKIAVAK